MSDYIRKDEADKRDIDNMKRHNYTLKGEEFVIKTNAAVGIASASDKVNEAKKKEDRALFERLARQALDYIDDQIKKIDKALGAGKTLRELHKKGELDYDNPEHIVLMNQYGITQNQIEAGGEKAFDERDQELINSKTEWENVRTSVEEAKNLGETNPEAAEERIRDISRKNEIGLSEFTEEELAGKTDRKFEKFDDFAFGDDMGSFASSEVPEGNIKAKPISDVFKAAHDNITAPVQVTEHAAKVDITLGMPS